MTKLPGRRMRLRDCMGNRLLDLLSIVWLSRLERAERVWPRCSEPDSEAQHEIVRSLGQMLLERDARSGRRSFSARSASPKQPMKLRLACGHRAVPSRLPVLAERERTVRANCGSTHERVPCVDDMRASREHRSDVFPRSSTFAPAGSCLVSTPQSCFLSSSCPSFFFPV